MVCPCKDCARREIGCHAECADYKAFQEYKRKENQNRKDFYGTLQMIRTGYQNIAMKKSPKPRRKRSY